MSTDRRFRVPDYLEHILEAIDRIQRYTKGLDEVGFSTNTLVHDASMRNFEIIGEACRRIRRDHPSFAARHPDLPLVVSLRDAKLARARLLRRAAKNRLGDDH